MFNIIKNLYGNSSFCWVNNFKEEDFPPAIVMFNYLIRDSETCSEIRHLSKYIYSLCPRTFVLLLHTYIKKRKLPFMKKKVVGEKIEIKEKIFDRLRKYFNYTEREFGRIENDILNIVGRDLVLWTKKLGINLKEKKDAK